MHTKNLYAFLGVFANLKEQLLALSWLSVCPSICMEQPGSHWMDSHEIL